MEPFSGSFCERRNTFKMQITHHLCFLNSNMYLSGFIKLQDYNSNVHILQLMRILNRNIRPMQIWDPDVKTGFAGNEGKWTRNRKVKGRKHAAIIWVKFCFWRRKFYSPLKSFYISACSCPNLSSKLTELRTGSQEFQSIQVCSEIISVPLYPQTFLPAVENRRRSLQMNGRTNNRPTT